MYEQSVPSRQSTIPSDGARCIVHLRALSAWGAPRLKITLGAKGAGGRVYFAVRRLELALQAGLEAPPKLLTRF